MDIVLELCNPLGLDPVYDFLRSRLHSYACNAVDGFMLGSTTANLLRLMKFKTCLFASDIAIWDAQNVYRESISIFMITLYVALQAFDNRREYKHKD